MSLGNEKTSRLIVIIGLLITVIIAGLFLRRPSFLNYIDQKFLDIISTSNPGSDAPDSQVIVDIDEKSLEIFGQWPWPRYRIAMLLQKIKALGAKSITVDLLFSEPDRTSPATMRADVKRDLKLDVEFKGIPPSLKDHDSILARTIAGGPFVLSNKFIFDGEKSDHRNCGLHPIEVAWLKETSDKHVTTSIYRALDVVCNIKPLSSSVSHSGFLNAVPDRDGILRRAPLIIEYNGKYYPSLALSGMMQHLGARQVMVKIGPGGMESVALNKTIIPVDKNGNILINYQEKKGAFDSVSAIDILNDRIPMDMLADKFVFVGTSAAGLGAYYQIPNGSLVPGVEIQATIAGNILHRNFIYKAPVVKVWELILILLCGIGLSVMLARIGAIKCGIVTAVLAGGIWAGSVTLFNTHGIIFSPFFPLLILLCNFLVLTSLGYWLRERKAIDTTKNTLVKLKESQGQLNSIVKTIPDVVYRLDRFGRIIFVNDAVERYGYRPEELIGTEVIDLVASDDRNDAKYRINERRTGDRATNGLELRLLVKDRAVAPVEKGWRHFIIAAEGLYRTNKPQADSFAGTQGIARDISESKQLQRQLLQAQKMEAVGTLAGGIAHDFNNLLMGIQGNTSLLLSDIDSGHPHFEGLKNIETHVHGAANLTNQLLGFARKGQFDVVPTNLNDIVIQSTQLFGRTKKEIKIHTKLVNSLWFVDVDQGQIEQVLLNLFINAWQAMPEGGDLFVETDNVVLDESFVKPFEVDPGDFVKVSVIDTGIGMDGDIVERLFEPFFTTKEMGRGTGLGLASAYGIVQNHKGIINVQSKRGHGSQFDIYIPVSIKVPRAERGRITDLFKGSENILLVDDEQLILDLGQSMLKKLGYQVIIAKGGKSAIEVYRRNSEQIDLIILDMIMPDMGGKETFTKLKILDPDIKVLLSSGYSLDGGARELMECGCNGFIQKPFGINFLSQKVREVLDQE